MSEEWRDVPGYEGLYQVSSAGRVRSARREGSKGGLLSPGTNGVGHLHVNLCRDGIKSTGHIHRLVALAFLPPCPPGHEVCHRDGDPANNDVSNLYWGTRSENVQDQVRHGVHGQSSKTHCVNGHELSGSNLHPRSDGGRRCIECRRAASRRYKARQRSKAA